MKNVRAKKKFPAPSLSMVTTYYNITIHAYRPPVTLISVLGFHPQLLRTNDFRKRKLFMGNITGDGHSIT
jgi:hypothetical protein